MAQEKIIYDVIIVGAGPAGMTAAIYASRRAMKTLIVGQDVGGQMAKTLRIENWPGIKMTDGVSLAFQMKEQVERFGAEFEIGEVVQIKKSVISHSIKEPVVRNIRTVVRNIRTVGSNGTTTGKSSGFRIITKEGKSFKSKSVILAFGLEKRKLGLRDEDKFVGQGLSYCVSCDGPLFKGRNVAVVGGGNSGAEAVEFLAKICPKVYWLELLDHLNADQIFIKRIKKLVNTEILLGTQISELGGDIKLEGIKLKTKADILAVQGVFVEVGYQTKTDWLKGLVELDKTGQVKVNKFCHTNVPGIFAAGDVTNVKYKQIVVAEGMGAVAALETYEYINRLSASAP